MQWYYSKHGTQLGPVDISDLRNKIAIGEVAPTDLVWRDGMPDWVPSSRVPELQPAAAGPPPVVGGNLNTPYAPPQAQPYQSVPYSNIPTNLWQSIVVTLLCCLPFGVVAIVYAAKVDSLARSGNIPGAMAAAANSRKWCNISVIAWFAVMLIGFLAGERGHR